MAQVALCRLCLADDVRLHNLAGTALQEFYEKITNVSLVTGAKPVTACYICYAQLKKYQQFLEKSVKANELLTQILSCGVELTQKSVSVIDRQTHRLTHALQISSVQCIAIVENESNPIRIKEEPAMYDSEVKGENAKDTAVKNTSHVTDSEDDLPLKDISSRRRDGNKWKRSKKQPLVSPIKYEMAEVNGDQGKSETRNGDKEEAEGNHTLGSDNIHSDSEDDLPLHNIGNDKERKETPTTSKKGVEEKKRLKKEYKMEAREIILTKEQQLEELMERSKSLNYLNSPYKCNLCYKGFVDLRAYVNHREKHDERSGAYECAVCRLRYGSRRQLRAHAAAAHARRYACARCPHRAHTANQAREHEKWHNGYTYECQLCSQKFRKPTSYLTHTRKRHASEHVCAACGVGCVGARGLRMHRSKAHRRAAAHLAIENPEEPETDRFCAECNIQFASIEAWKRHILSSVKHKLASENSSECGICGAAVAGEARAQHRRLHERALRNTAPVPATTHAHTRLACDQCGANFVNRSKLQAHIKRIHLGLKYNKNIVCEICGKKCTSNASLRYHQRTHTGEKPYSCSTCSKRFSDNNQLRIHTRTHTGERPYCCAVCGKRFSQKPALNRHYRVHTGAKPYACQFCSKTFSQSNSLKLHVRTVHLKLPSTNKRNKVQSQEDKEKKSIDNSVQTVQTL
ncbi:zinc finger protein 16-like [Galleria mellonella]|uniref:Zinc finger protein 16-like n=1 Tax=Galleria mellonella TaxID=7137 RepID=A0ABM3M9E9_GALME|nr:zinc finger protein 16-like [Galleria mellonella]